MASTYGHLNLHGWPKFRKSVTDKASDSGCHGAPFAMNPHGVLGVNLSSPLTSCGEQTVALVEMRPMQTWFALLRKAETSHSLIPEALTGPEMTGKKCPKLQKKMETEEGSMRKRERTREREGGKEGGWGGREGGTYGWTDIQALLALGRSSRPVTIRKGNQTNALDLCLLNNSHLQGCNMGNK